MLPDFERVQAVPNLYRVSIGTLSLFFHYETLVGVLLAGKNRIFITRYWHTLTTKRALTQLEKLYGIHVSIKKFRLDDKEFKYEASKTILEGIGKYDATLSDYIFKALA